MTAGHCPGCGQGACVIDFSGEFTPPQLGPTRLEFLIRCYCACGYELNYAHTYFPPKPKRAKPKRVEAPRIFLPGDQVYCFQHGSGTVDTLRGGPLRKLIPVRFDGRSVIDIMKPEDLDHDGY